MSHAAVVDPAAVDAGASAKRRLLVIIPDELSALVRKGEITARYYNPGELFDEVHLLLINDDRPDPAAVQPMVGRARLVLHNLPAPRGLFLRSWGWRPWALGAWAQPGLALARRLQPSLVRCHGHGLNALLARRIKEACGIPYVVSLHGNPDVDGLRGRLGRTWRQRLAGHALAAAEAAGLQAADRVIAVYEPIVPYLRRLGLARYAVIHNSVGVTGERKVSYALDPQRVRVLCVGRQEPRQKDPRPIIEAAIGMPEIQLTLVGDGALHAGLVALVQRAGAASRIRFERQARNADVLRRMAQADLFAYASVNYEISKGCIEAALIGLPVVLNRRQPANAPELEGGHFCFVEGSAASYAAAFRALIDDEARRRELGERAAALARARWAPARLEGEVAALYQRVMAEAGPRA